MLYQEVNQMANILYSPSRYVQGAGEMKKLGEYADHTCIRVFQQRMQ